MSGIHRFGVGPTFRLYIDRRVGAALLGKVGANLYWQRQERICIGKGAGKYVWANVGADDILAR